MGERVRSVVVGWWCFVDGTSCGRCGLCCLALLLADEEELEKSWILDYGPL